MFVLSQFFYFLTWLIFVYGLGLFLVQMSHNKNDMVSWAVLDMMYRKLIAFCEPFFTKQRLGKYYDFLAHRIQCAGLKHKLTVSKFMARCFIQMLGVLFICVVLRAYFSWPMEGLFIVLASLIWLGPLWKLERLSRVREASGLRDLPYFLDYLSLGMEAGLDLTLAWARAAEYCPESPLRHEMQKTLSSIRLGKSRAQALKELADRMPVPGVRFFVQSLDQAIRMGSDLSLALQTLSSDLQNRRFQNAEEKAGKISVQMMLPMMCFVMPSTVIILLGPMIIEWLNLSIH